MLEGVLEKREASYTNMSVANRHYEEQCGGALKNEK